MKVRAAPGVPGHLTGAPSSVELRFSGIRDLHHLHLFTLAVRSVHFKNLRIGVWELPDRPMLHDAFERIGVTPFERNGLVVGTGLPFHGKNASSH